jgi:hypothetical protein
MTYTCVQQGVNALSDPNQRVAWGLGTIEADPLFADPGYWDPNGTADDPNDDFFVEGDYHLKSQGGRWEPASESWVLDEVTSPCIDAGDPNSPVGDEPVPNGGRINMSAYGGTIEASKSPGAGTAPSLRVVYIFADEVEAAQGFQSLLQEHGCSVTQLAVHEVTETALASCDVIVAGNDSGYMSAWGSSQSVAAVADSGKPVLGLGEGGYALFGKLGLAIGHPEGGHAHDHSIYVVDPESPLFKAPHPIAIGEDRTLSLYGETEDVSIWLPSIPETIVPFGRSEAGSEHYPLVQEGGRYLLWGFVEPPASMTPTGRDLFINAVVLAASSAWEL